MSGVKYARPNYNQLYQQELYKRQQLEQQNRELERKTREQEIVKRQVAESEKRIKKEMEALQTAAKKTSEELLRLQEKQKRTIEEITGVKVQINETNQSINKLTWTTQQQFERMISEQEKTQALVHQNRQEIKNNRLIIEKGFRNVDSQIQEIQKHLDSIELRNQLEQERTATNLRRTILMIRFDLDDETLIRFAPEQFESAKRLSAEFDSYYDAGDFVTAIAVANSAITAMNDAVNQAKEQFNNYDTLRRHALETYNKFERVRDSLVPQENSETNFNDVRLWLPEKFSILLEKSKQLEIYKDEENYQALLNESESLFEEAIALRREVEILLDQHIAREMLVETLVEAFTAHGPITPGDIGFDDVDNPNSDVVIYTDGPEIRLPIEGNFRFENPQNPDLNRRHIEQAEKVLQQQGKIKRLNY